MANVKNSIKILYLNTYGQTKFTVEKQFQIQDMVIHYKCDIIHLQETDCKDDTFESCNFLNNNYNLIKNNSSSKFGTASLVKNNFNANDVSFDTEGRVIIFKIGSVTFSNVYLEAGTDSLSRSARENYCGEVLPNLLINCGQDGLIGGDWNCILDKKDATAHPDAKMSPNLARLVKTFHWKDSLRILKQNVNCFSHYYKSGDQVGATRIDRQYHWGEVEVLSAEYVPAAFSDHLGFLVEVRVPSIGTDQVVSRGLPFLKINDDVTKDIIFKQQVAEAMENWKVMKDQGLEVLTWWELVVKPGLREIALNRSKVMNRERRGELNMLLIQQAYLVKKLCSGTNSLSILTDLSCVQASIREWYQKQSKKIQHQSRKDEFQTSENTRIYHHEIHQKKISKSSILKLDTEKGLIEGHDKCAAYLEQVVRELLSFPADLDPTAQDTLLAEVAEVFTEADNSMLKTLPSKEEIFNNLKNSNLKASAGTDGISALVYKECWDSLGESILEVQSALFSGLPLTTSMCTSLMIFSTKPKKSNSIKPSDKRRISILNCDYKLYEALYARRFRRLGSRTLSQLQYVAGTNRTIQHGIARARDAINSASHSRLRCGIGDQDYIAAFDFLVLSWVWKVLERKGVHQDTLVRLKKLYHGGITIPVVNCLPGRAILDKRGSLRQGGVGSMDWFAVGIDPLLAYLERRLVGIPVISLPVLGPSEEGQDSPLPCLEERFKVMAFCDDVKPAICSLNEFSIADEAASLFEGAGGTRLHRDPNSNKCKFLPLGRWRQELQQDDIPTPYMRLTDTLDMVGVELCATWSKTRQKNGDSIKNKVSKTIGAWRAGKFMPLTARPVSANMFALSKVLFRCATVNIREGDILSINSSVKRWIYADQLLKPAEMVLHRPVHQGGLGLVSVKYKARASLLRTFIELAVNPEYITSIYLSSLYRVHVLGEDLACPPLPPYYDKNFFTTICQAAETGADVTTMTSRQWYNFLLQQETMMVDQPNMLRPCRVEERNPYSDWSAIWTRVRLPSLTSEACSMAWRLVHQLLPCESRLSEIMPNISPTCKFSCEGEPTADLVHCFFACKLSAEAGDWIMYLVLQYDPFATREKLLRLEVEGNEALVWIVIVALNFIWNRRSKGRYAKPQECIATILADTIILRESNLANLGLEIEQILNNSYIFRN